MLKLVKAQGQGLVSDRGRCGFQHEGVPQGGVLDQFSYVVANLALGNPTDAACLELMGQFDFVCAKPCKILFANCGAHAVLNHKAVLGGKVLSLQTGDVLRTLAPSLGFWNVLCLQGGVDVPLVMGSRSTCLGAGFGGFQGRALQVGDEIHAGHEFKANVAEHCRLAMPLAQTDASGTMPIYCLAGPDFESLIEESQHLFSSQTYVLGAQSSRMGYRMEAAAGRLQLNHNPSLRSHAVHPGIVQLPPSGQPVVLLSEAQVTGGYPRIASVLQCELWKLSQLGAGQGVHWKLCNAEQADRLQMQHADELRKYAYVIESNCQSKCID